MDFMLGGRMGERTSFADEDDFEAWLARIMAENIISTEETDATNETPVTHGTPSMNDVNVAYARRD